MKRGTFQFCVCDFYSKVSSLSLICGGELVPIVRRDYGIECGIFVLSSFVLSKSNSIKSIRSDGRYLLRAPSRPQCVVLVGTAVMCERVQAYLPAVGASIATKRAAPSD